MTIELKSKEVQSVANFFYPVVNHYGLLTLTVIVLFYGLGRYYHKGYLAYFGLQENLFPLEFHDALLLGMIPTSKLFDFIGYYLIFIIIVTAIVFFINLINKFILHLFNNIITFNYSNRKPDTQKYKINLLKNFFMKFLLSSIYFLTIGLIVLIFSLTLKGSYFLGNYIAKHDQAKWDNYFKQIIICQMNKNCEIVKKNLPTSFLQITMKDSHKNYNGFIIDSGQNFIAFYAIQRELIVKKLMDIETIRKLEVL